MSTIFCLFLFLFFSEDLFFQFPHCHKSRPLCLDGKGQEAEERCPPQVTTWSFNGLSTLSSHLTERILIRLGRAEQNGP